LALTGFAALAGLSAMIEMLYHLQLNQALGPNLKFMGLNLNAASTTTWLGAAAVLVLGAVAFEFVRRGFAKKWGAVQEDIERLVKAQETKPSQAVPAA
jgi:branched-chain amino acid transport system permease protein